MSDVWDKIFTGEGFCTDLNPREFVKDNIAVIAPPGPILDIGCGFGRHAVYLAANGYHVYGIDTSEVALAAANENLRQFGLSAQLECATMWDIPFDDVIFPAALAINVLNHGVPDEVSKTVSTMADRLVPGGIFLVTLLTQNDYRRCGEQIGPDTFIGDKGPEAGVLHTFFSEDSARALLEKSFTVETIHTSSGPFRLTNGENVQQEFLQIRATRKG